MSSPVQTDQQLLFQGFLQHLEGRGFAIGIDHYLRMELLLAKVAGDCGPKDLKSLLCPIFASDRTQQQYFSAAFDDYFQLFAEEIAREQPDVRVNQEPAHAKYIRKWPYVLAGFFLVIVGLGSIFFYQQKQGETTGIAVDPIPIDSTLKQPQPIPADPKAIPYQADRRITAGLRWSAVLIPLLLLATYEFFLYRRRKLVTQNQRLKKPPYFLSLRTTATRTRMFRSELFFRVARLLRRRQGTTFKRLDIVPTINSTIEARGFPSFQYKWDNKEPEYLVLIDRKSYYDQQARLFDELINELSRDSVQIERYFYNTDPRVCSRFPVVLGSDPLVPESGGRRPAEKAGVLLETLQASHEGYRLLILGDGRSLLDPISGELAEWLNVFESWHERAVLTTIPPDSWGPVERMLSEYFRVHYASLEGLQKLTIDFELRELENIEPLGKGKKRRFEALRDPDETINRLRQYLGDRAFQWLCACAVYPELQWDLTMHLGSLPAIGRGSIDVESLTRLVSLPWFHGNRLDDELRWQLLKQFGGETENSVRAAIIELLEKNTPSNNSVAADLYHLNLAVQKWLFERTRKTYQELKAVINTLPRAEVYNDYVLIRFLESSRASVLDLILPRSLKKVLYPHGIIAFGMRSVVRAAVTLLIVASGWMVAPRIAGAIRQEPAPEAIGSILNIPPSPIPTPVIPTPSVQPSFNSSPTSSATPRVRPSVSPVLTPMPDTTGSVSPSITPAESSAASRQNDLGNQAWTSGNMAEALSAYAKARDLDPANALYHINVGTVLNRLGRYDEAVLELNKGISLAHPPLAWFYNELCVALTILGKTTQASGPCSEAIRLDPRNKGFQPQLIATLRSNRDPLAGTSPQANANEVTSFTFNYKFDPSPGLRRYQKLDDSNWIETYVASGQQSSYVVVGRAVVDGDQGTLLRGAKEPTFQVFVPDKRSKLMWVRFRHLVDGTWQPWQYLGEMQDVN